MSQIFSHTLHCDCLTPLAVTLGLDGFSAVCNNLCIVDMIYSELHDQKCILTVFLCVNNFHIVFILIG